MVVVTVGWRAGRVVAAAAASGSIQRGRSSLHDPFDVLGLDAGCVHDVLAPEGLSALLEVFALEPQGLELVDGHALVDAHPTRAEPHGRVVGQDVIGGQGAVVTEHAGRDRLLFFVFITWQHFLGRERERIKGINSIGFTLIHGGALSASS